VGSPYLSNVCREVAGISEVISAVNLQLIEMNRVKSSVPRSHFGLRAQVIRLRSKSATTIARSGKACGPPTKLPSIGTNKDQRLCMALKLTIQAFFYSTKTSCQGCSSKTSRQTLKDDRTLTGIR